MGKNKVTKQFGAVKRMIAKTDPRLKDVKEKLIKKQQADQTKTLVRHIPQVASSLFFQHNEALVPPYHVIVDTNFINFSIQNKLEIIKAMMDCCLVARDPRFERLPCSHKGTYADDCIVNRIMQHKCYIVATCDKDLKRRIRKIPGVPIMYIAARKFAIERLPEVPI
ncbi:hypothetical protein BASA60_005568 [Batrachochytrium salamandrivorans]|nr:hypothetical protein BASA60_005568 [Batrachochytrium salamandrivorans]